MNDICIIKDIYKALYQFEKRFAEEYQITINEGVLLCCMKDDKPRPASDLCEFVGLSNSRVSRVITSVEEKGFIQRRMGEHDKRQMIFTLTEAGRSKIKDMSESHPDFSDFKTELLQLANSINNKDKK